MTQLTPHQRSALEFEDHISLTANAGSGKTFVLARRYLNAALKDGVNLSGIAAITFTDKAAGELYNKIVRLINELITISDSETEKFKLERIRRHLVSSNISTIHSFCINILREFPVEAGLDARFSPIDEQLSDELIDLSIEEVVRELLVDVSSSDDIKYLIRILGSKSRLEAELYSLIKQRKNLLVIRDSIYSKSEEEIVKHFQSRFDLYFFQIWNHHKDSLIESADRINQAVLSKNPENDTAILVSSLIKNFEKLITSDKVLKFISEIRDALLTTGGKVKNRGYLTTDIRDGFESDINNVETYLGEFSKIEYSAESEQLLKELAGFGKVLLKVFDHTLKAYESRKSAEGFLDYEDILLFTKEILKNESVQKSLNEKFKFILVDEYQDTNEIQYEIFLPILDYLKTGNLFIVGDEKQSIYMFRDAELEIFNRTKNDISKVSGSGSLLELPDSFRMAPAVCMFTNRLFANLFADPNQLYNEVKNTDIVCARNDDRSGEIEFILTDPDSENSVSEAELVARRIIELKSNGKEFSDIAILVRKRKSFRELEIEFIKHGVPFSIIGGRGFYQRQTISDVYNYLSFLSNSSNSTALVGILRSPFFTIPDSTLFEISLMHGENFWEKLKQYALKDSEFVRIKDILEENLQFSSSAELTVLLRKILSDTEYLAVIAARNDGDQELANIQKLFEISRGFSLKGFRNLYDFLDYLKDAITGIEDESQAAVASDSNAVQLMTLHQAKGLEFPVVILYKTHESGLKTLVKSKQISLSKIFGILTKLPVNENFLADYSSTPVGGLYNFIEEKKRIAELKRLLYVGITRSVDHLIISGEFSDGQSLKNDSFLSLIKSGLDLDLGLNDFIIEDKLMYLVQTDTGFSNLTKNLRIKIPVHRTISIAEDYKPTAKSKPENLIVNIENIAPPLEKDIISATKVSVYHQCPAKYQLTYEYGFGKLNNLLMQNNRPYFRIEDDDFEIEREYKEEEIPVSTIQADVKGTLIHALLEKEISLDGMNDEIVKYCRKRGLGEKEISNYKKEIVSDMKKFLMSDIYREISSCPDYRNEYELYIKYEESFLYGIIDKIIFSGDELIIVDYKTDDISEDDIDKRAETYFTQLNFYLFIAKKLFSNYNSFRLILIFIKHPDKPVIKKLDNDQFFLVKKEISDIIKGIIHKNFHKNTEHCGICVYSNKNKKCILNSDSERDIL